MGRPQLFKGSPWLRIQLGNAVSAFSFGGEWQDLYSSSGVRVKAAHVVLEAGFQEV